MSVKAVLFLVRDVFDVIVSLEVLLWSPVLRCNFFTLLSIYERQRSWGVSMVSEVHSQKGRRLLCPLKVEEQEPVVQPVHVYWYTDPNHIPEVRGLHLHCKMPLGQVTKRGNFQEDDMHTTAGAVSLLRMHTSAVTKVRIFLHDAHTALITSESPEDRVDHVNNALAASH